MDDPQQLLTLQEVAAYLRVSISTVRREIAKGRLEAVRVGHLYRVRRADMNAYLEGLVGLPQHDWRRP
jgi:excisionase family DNA binding protein